MPGCLRLHASPARLAARRAPDTISKPVGLDTTLTQAKRLSQNGHGIERLDFSTHQRVPTQVILFRLRVLASVQHRPEILLDCF